MIMAIFTGSGTAVCTPFHSTTGAFNYAAYEKLINFQIKNQTDAIVSCGTTGESSTLDNEEHVEVVRAAVEITKKAAANGLRKIPVIAGGGGNDTRDCIRLGKEMMNAGADALMFCAPYYNKTSQKGLVEHYMYIADNVNTPIILYNVPGRTGCNMSVATYKALAQHRNIVAVKEASGDISKVAETLAACGDMLDVYSGNDDQILPILALGGAGVISVLSNISPRDTHDMCAKFFAGDLAGARDMQLRYMELVGALFCDVNPIPVKEAMNLMDMNVGQCRLPLCGMDDAGKARLTAALNNMGML